MLLEAGKRRARERRPALGERLPDACAARAGAGGPARRGPGRAGDRRHPRPRPGAVRGGPARAAGRAGARPRLRVRWEHQGEQLDERSTAAPTTRSRCWSVRSRPPAQEDDVEGAFRLEAQLNLIAQRPLPEARGRLTPYVERIPPDSRTGRLAAALESEWHAFDGTRPTRSRRPAARSRATAASSSSSRSLRARPAGAGADPRGRARRGRRAAEQAHAFARRRSAMPELIAAWWLSGGVALRCGDLAAAEADARQGLEVARLGGLRFAEAPVRAVLAACSSRAGSSTPRRPSSRRAAWPVRSRTPLVRALAVRARTAALRAGTLRGGRRRPLRAASAREAAGGDRGARAARRASARARPWPRSASASGRATHGGGGARPRAALGRADARSSRALCTLALAIGGGERARGAGGGGRRARRLARAARRAVGARRARRRAAAQRSGAPTRARRCARRSSWRAAAAPPASPGARSTSWPRPARRSAATRRSASSRSRRASDASRRWRRAA